MLTFAQAKTIMDAALAHAADKSMKPLGVVIVDNRGAVRHASVQDGNSLMRFEIAHGKAFGAVGMGLGTRTMNQMALDRPHFMNAFVAATGGRAVPVPGGVLVRDPATNALLGAVGVSGDTSDNDEAVAMAGIAAAGLKADPGA
jgi:uncharacterized protein GlcG (DUF336 family)